MECLKCDNTKMEMKKVRFNPEVKGVNVDVIVDALVCAKCHSPVMDPSMMNTLRSAAADKYREINGLLTSSEIREYRKNLGLSQTAFARYLNVGEASIKRWETYYVQDAVQDEHIRLKCDKVYAELNSFGLISKTQEPDQFNGHKRFSLEAFKHVALFLVSQCQTTKLYLNKIHFYIDFLHYKKTGRSLTGAQYVPMKYGPCPKRYNTIYDFLVDSCALEVKGEYGFKAVEELDMSYFDDSEKETLEYVLSICNEKGVEYLYDLSHGEKGYTETDENELIDYEYSQELQL